MGFTRKSNNQSGNTSLTSLPDVDINSPIEGNILSYDATISKWVPRSISSSSTFPANTYYVELSRWGIKNDGTSPTATINGINNMMMWAKNNGYRAVYLDAGTYSLDMNVLNKVKIWQLDGRQREETGIIMQDGLSLYMHSDTILKVAPNSQPYQYGINIAGVKDISIVGGQLIGDRYTHDYGAKCIFEFGDLDLSGNPTLSTTILRSKDYIQYWGNGTQVPLNVKFCKLDGIVPSSSADYRCTVYCYNASGVLLQRITDVAWFEQTVSSPFGTVKWKLTMVQNACTDKTSAFIPNSSIYPTHEFGFGICLHNSENINIRNMSITQWTGDGITPIDAPTASPNVYSGNRNIYIENCLIDDNRRQGISVVEGDHIYIRHCTISNTRGNDPQFGIDLESSGGFGDEIYVEDCEFINNEKGDIVSYDGTGIYIKRCKFSALVGSTYGYNFDIQDCIFKDTTGKRTALQASVNVLNVEGSFFKVKNCEFTGYGKVGFIGNCKLIEFTGNRINDTDTTTLTLTIAKTDTLVVKDNVYVNTGQITYYYNNTEIATNGVISGDNYINCSNVSLPDTCLISDLNFDRSSVAGKGHIILNSCYINTGKRNKFKSPFLANSDTLSMTMVGGSIIGETLDRTGSMLGGSGMGYKMKFKGVSMKTNAMSLFLSYSPLELIDCDMELTDDVGVTSNITLFATGGANSPVHMRNCNWKYIGDAMPIFNINGTSAFLFNNTFDSVTQPQFNFSSTYFESGTTLISGATTNQNPSNKRTTEPNSGTYELGRIVYHSAPVAGGFLGWVCTTRGIANNDPWTTNNAAWVGRIIKANGKVYKCTTAGTTGSVAPSHTTGTATDGTVVWTYQDTLAVFKTFGVIST